MKGIAVFGALALMTAATPAPAKKPKLPPYPEALRCAGLAEAASRIEGLPPKEFSTAFEGAIFWGMAASEAARKGGLTARTFTADQVREAATAEAELKGSDSAAAKAELAACLSRVPPTKR